MSTTLTNVVLQDQGAIDETDLYDYMRLYSQLSVDEQEIAQIMQIKTILELQNFRKLNKGDKRIAYFMHFPTINALKSDDRFNSIPFKTREHILNMWYNKHNITTSKRDKLSNTYSDNKSKKSRTLLTSSASLSLKENSQESESKKIIYDLCKSQFKNIDTTHKFYDTIGRPIKKLINKYRKICHTIVNPKSCFKKNMNIMSKIRVRFLKKRELPTITISTEPEILELYKLYNSKLNAINQENILKYSLDSFFIKYAGQPGIDAGGLSRNFALKVAEQLFTLGNPLPVKKSTQNNSNSNSSEYSNKPQHGIFVEIEKKSNIFILNDKVDLEIFRSVDSTINKEKVFTFAGAVYAWLMANGIKCQHRLSKAILLNLLYKDLPDKPADSEISNDDYGMIMLLESPTLGNSFVELLKYADNPNNRISTTELPKISEFLYVDYNFNELDENGIITLKPKLKPPAPLNLKGFLPTEVSYKNAKETYEKAMEQYDKDNLVTFANFREYIGLLGRHRLVSHNGDRSLIDAFTGGFYITKRWLKNRDVTIPFLDFLTFGIDISPEIIEIILDEVKTNSTTKTDNGRKILTWFSNILRGVQIDDKKYLELLDKAKENTKDAIAAGELTKTQYDLNTPNTYNEFLPKLLKYWGGTANYYKDPKYPYKIAFQNEGNKILIHSCFFTLDIPTINRDGTPFIKDADDLFIQLIMNIILTGNAFNER